MLRLWHFFSCAEQGGDAGLPTEQNASPAAAAEGDSPKAAPAESVSEAVTATETPDTAPAAELNRLNRHLSELRRQEAQLRELIPDFDLGRELRRDPRLLRLTAPGSPLTLAEALTALHLPRLIQMREQRLVQQLREGFAKSLMSGAVPPPLPDTAFDPGEAPLDRERLKERIRGGERIKAR